LVTEHDKGVIVSSAGENKWYAMKFQGAWNMTKAMDCNKTWKMMTTDNNSSQPRVLKMEASRWLPVKHGNNAIRNGSKWCSNNEKQVEETIKSATI
jgi:hypothetical protein